MCLNGFSKDRSQEGGMAGTVKRKLTKITKTAELCGNILSTSAIIPQKPARTARNRK
jgi:hypothetical protein